MEFDLLDPLIIAHRNLTEKKLKLSWKVSRFKEKKSFKVIQFSPARSGSTLVFNAIKYILPNTKIIKTHTMSDEFCNLPIITTKRNIFDCLVSLANAHGQEVSDENIAHFANILKKSGHSNNKINCTNKLELEYNIFYKNYDYLFKQISNFFHVHYTRNQIETFEREFNVKKIRSKTQNHVFEDYDKATQLHGRHVSSNLGEPGAGFSLTDEQKQIVLEVVSGK